MSCDPKLKCGNSGSVDPETGRDLMISRLGNPKFGGKAMVVHPQCEACLVEQIAKQAIKDCMEAKEMGLALLEKALGIPRK